MNRCDIYLQDPEKGDFDQYIKEEHEYVIPVADQLDTKMFSSETGGSIKISPIAMIWDSTGGTAPKGADIDSVESFSITYNDGSEYLVYDENTASIGYICGTDTGFIVLFNRLVDIDNVAYITINGENFTVNG